MRRAFTLPAARRRLREPLRLRQRRGGASFFVGIQRQRIHPSRFEIDVESAILEFSSAEHLPEQFQNGGRHPLIDEEILMCKRFGQRTARRIAVLRSFEQLRPRDVGPRQFPAAVADQNLKVY